jgi:TolB protein
VRAILKRDLDFSDRITTITLDSGDAPSGALNYPLYAKLMASAVVQAAVTPAGALHVAVHDVGQKRVALVMDIPLPSPALSGDWRAVVHAVSDSVEWVLLGQKGISSTRISFIKTTSHGSQMWTVDMDGANSRPVAGTDGALGGDWSANGKRIVYSTLPDDGHQRIVVRDLTGATPQWTTSAAATNVSPVFSPDGKQVVFAAGNDGSDLYIATIGSTDPPRRLTSRKGSSNSSPTFSPDGLRIAFTSGLLGHPEVYIMDADGSGADLLTSNGFGDQLYRSNPAWSPDGKYVAFQSRINGLFQVMTISVTDRSQRQLTSDGANEDPSWAPDGRHLVFRSTRTGVNELWVMDAESSVSRQLTHGGKVQNPAWSPRLELSRQP